MDTDPGAGYIRFDNDVRNSNYITISNTNSSGGDIEDWLNSLGFYLKPGDRIKIFKKEDPREFITWEFGALGSGTNSSNLELTSWVSGGGVNWVSGSNEVLMWNAEDELVLTLELTGPSGGPKGEKGD